MVRVPLGSPIPLVLEVFDGRATVYPRANVYDANFVEVSGSPFAMSHVANGLYKSTGFTPLTAGIFYAVFTIYSDNTYATVMNRYARASEDYDVNTLIADTLGLNATIGTPVTGTVVSDIQNADSDSDDARTA